MARIYIWSREEQRKARMEGFYSTEQLVRRWEARRVAQAPRLLALIVGSMAWISAVPAVMSFAGILGGGLPSHTNAMTYAFLAAAVLTAAECTSEAGTATTSDWMSTWPMLSAPEGEVGSNDMTHTHNGFGPMQAFEMAYLLAHSRTLWLYSMDRILLSVALFCGAILTYSTHQLSRAHAHFAMLTSFVCWIGFGFDVTRYVNWRVASNGSIVVGILLDAILLPIWLLGLAYQLRKVARQGGGYEAEKSPPVASVQMTRPESEISGQPGVA